MPRKNSLEQTSTYVLPPIIVEMDVPYTLHGNAGPADHSQGREMKLKTGDKVTISFSKDSDANLIFSTSDNSIFLPVSQAVIAALSQRTPYEGNVLRTQGWIIERQMPEVLIDALSRWVDPRQA